jgi:hypothetical protein
VINLQTYFAAGRGTVRNWTGKAGSENAEFVIASAATVLLADSAAALPWNSKENDMVRALQTRIMQNGSGWYWEVIRGDEVIGQGVADTHAGARAAASKVASQDEETWQAGTSSDQSTTFRH